MEKHTLRNALFQKYFEVKDGVLATELIDKLSFVKDIWVELAIILEKNVKSFDRITGTIKDIKMVERNQKQYLIIKKYFWRYIIIDIEQNQNITHEDFIKNFDEDFFVKNFGEEKFDIPNIFPRPYGIEKYEGDPKELINFYTENESILTSPSEIACEHQIGEAYTYFYINFITQGVQLLFGTPDQFLYEQLFMNYDLSPKGLQDATEKIGYERMLEIFAKVKEIIIPYEQIPEELYKLYESKCSEENIKRRNKKQ